MIRRAGVGEVAGAWRDPAPDGTPNAVGDWLFDIRRFAAALTTVEQRQLLRQLRDGEICVKKPAKPSSRPFPLTDYHRLTPSAGSIDLVDLAGDTGTGSRDGK